MQRIISGTMKDYPKSDDAIYNIRYNALPVAYDTTLRVLETDYKNFALIWSCNAIGSLGHTESVWVMAREREPPGTILQTIYGVLDKFKISRTFFVETDQKNCETTAPPQEAIDPISDPSNELRSDTNGNHILAPGQTSKTVMISKETIRNFVPKVAPEQVKTVETLPVKTEEPQPVMIVDAVKSEDKPLKTIVEPVVTILAQSHNNDAKTILRTADIPQIVEPTKVIETIEETPKETLNTIETMPVAEKANDIKMDESPKVVLEETKTLIETVPVPIQSQQTVESVPIIQEPDFKIKTVAVETEKIIDAPIIATTLNEKETAPLLEFTRNVEAKPTLTESETPSVAETLPKVILTKTDEAAKPLLFEDKKTIAANVVEEIKSEEPVKVIEEVIMMVEKIEKPQEMKETIKEPEIVKETLPEAPLQSQQTMITPMMVDDKEPIIKTIETMKVIPVQETIVEKTDEIPAESPKTVETLPVEVETIPLESTKIIETRPAVESIQPAAEKIEIIQDTNKETVPIESTKIIETIPVVEMIELIETKETIPIEAIKTIVEPMMNKITSTPNKSMIQESIDAVEQAVRAIKEAESLKETTVVTETVKEKLPADIALVGAIKSGVTRTNLETEKLSVEKLSGSDETKLADVVQQIPVHIVSV